MNPRNDNGEGRAQGAGGDAFDVLLEFLRDNRGFDFTGYKRPSLERRIRKRMTEVGVSDFDSYIDRLEVEPEEFTHLFNTILVNLTSFFRDPDAWEYLAAEIIPRIVSAKAPDEPIRIWSAGCASGEETYTIAMLLAEAIGIEAAAGRMKLYATDVDEEALAQARQAVYTERDLKPVSEELRHRYFKPAEDGFIFHPTLRRAVVFGRHDLVRDAPIPHLDLIVCRNVLIYLNGETQAGVLQRFHFALDDGGFLFLGRAEMLLARRDLFTPDKLGLRIFSKVAAPARPVQHFSDARLDEIEAMPEEYRQRLRWYATDLRPGAQLIVDASGKLADADRQAIEHFGIGPHDLGRPFQDLEVSYRPVELRSLIERVTANRRPVTLRDVERRSEEGSEFFDVDVAVIEDGAGGLLGTSILFKDVTEQRRLRIELERSREDLETAYEELQATNEELETTNEELQATNEELETTNEELQATNQELEATNQEINRRAEETSQVNAFLEAVLSSLRSGVIVVDWERRVMGWNHVSEDLWGLRADEVRGERLASLDIGMPYRALDEPINACLEGDAVLREVVVEATSRRGKAIQCRVVCSPLLGDGDRRLGVILLIEPGEGEWASGK